MVWTNVGKSGTGMILGPSGAGNYPNAMELDAGSQAVTTSTSGCNSAFLGRGITSYDQTIPNQVTYTADWNSVELSGLSTYGFGLKLGSGTSGANWVQVNFADTGSINFDGAKELQVQITLRVK